MVVFDGLYNSLKELELPKVNWQLDVYKSES